MVDSYARLDRYSVSCVIAVIEKGQCSALGSFAYRFDRGTNRLAIEGDETKLLVEGNRAFLLLSIDETTGVPTYLKIERRRPVSWRNIDDALAVIRKECPSTTGLSFYNPSFALPFLDGGIDKLFSQKATALNLDPKVAARLASDMSQTGEFAKHDKTIDWDVEVFGIGHPDYKFFIGPPPKKPKLDPKKFPICFRTEDAVSNWRYAFDPQAGTLSAAVGVVDCREIHGVPGNKVTIYIKPTISFGEGEVTGEFRPARFQLSEEANVIGMADFKNFFHRAMRQIGTRTFLERKADLEKELQTGSIRNRI